MNIIYFGLNSNRSFMSGKKPTYDNWSVQYTCRLKKNSYPKGVMNGQTSRSQINRLKPIICVRM